MSDQDMMNAIIQAIQTDETLLQLIRLAVTSAVNNMQTDQLTLIMNDLNLPTS